MYSYTVVHDTNTSIFLMGEEMLGQKNKPLKEQKELRWKLSGKSIPPHFVDTPVLIL